MLSPKYENETMQRATTDGDGYAKLTHRFMASGSTGVFEDVSHVYTDRVWARISAEGFSAVTVPLGQMTWPRSGDNDYPIDVTMLLEKVAAR